MIYINILAFLYSKIRNKIFNFGFYYSYRTIDNFNGKTKNFLNVLYSFKFTVQKFVRHQFFIASHNV
jgi:hypothetical protein